MLSKCLGHNTIFTITDWGGGGGGGGVGVS